MPVYKVVHWHNWDNSGQVLIILMRTEKTELSSCQIDYGGRCEKGLICIFAIASTKTDSFLLWIYEYSPLFSFSVAWRWTIKHLFQKSVNRKCWNNWKRAVSVDWPWNKMACFFKNSSTVILFLLFLIRLTSQETLLRWVIFRITKKQLFF